MKIEDVGKGLISLIEELNDRGTREAYNDENKRTFKNIGVGGDMTIVSEENGETIVQNKHGERFKVTGNGLTRRITRILSQEDMDKINRECPPAND